MAIIGNKATEIGDVIYIQASVPIVGLLALTSFIDDVDNETPTKYFTKKFRYSVDGINYSLWLDLTLSNVSAVVVDPTNTFYIEYLYKREGTDNTGDVSYNSTQVNGTIQPSVCPDIFVNSIFYQFFGCGDIEVLSWCVNVLEKIYEKGIIPTYIERGLTSNQNWEDRDYLDFWRTLCCFYAMIVKYSREFEDFHLNEILLLEYLRQKGLYICDKSNMQDLIYLKKHYFDEIRQRGTIMIIKEDSNNQLSLNSIFHTKSAQSKTTNGELLRLICYDKHDEFIFNLIKKQYVGINIDNSSPLFCGLTNQITVNKAYEDTQDFVDITKYPIYNPNYCSLYEDLIEGKWVFKIEGVPPGETSGISYDITTLSNTDFDNSIRVNENLDYEITFWVKTSSIGTPSKLTFGVIGLDNNNNKLNLLNIHTGVYQDIFIQNYSLPQEDTYYFIRGIIYNKSEQLKSLLNSFLNINDGVNLKFSDNITRIIPQVVVNNNLAGNSNAVLIWDFKVRPLKTPFSNGFTQPGNFLEIWLSQNNKSLTNLQVEDKMRRYLFPYNLAFRCIYLEPNSQESSGSWSV